jgi:hypothetical protein
MDFGHEDRSWSGNRPGSTRHASLTHGRPHRRMLLLRNYRPPIVRLLRLH